MWIFSRRSAAARRPAAAGGLPAFNQLVLEHQAWLYTIALRALGEPSAAAAATQAAIEQAFQEGAHSKAALLSCLMAAVGGASQDQAPRPTAPGAAAHQRLLALPLDLRLAVVLVDVAGLSQAEAAAALGQAPGAVAARLARGREALVRSAVTAEP